MKRLLAALLYTIIGLSLLADDAIRGPLVADTTIDMSAVPGPLVIETRPGELASIRLAGDTRLLEALQIEIEVPREIARSPHGFAIHVYRGVTPAPSPTQAAYTGDLLVSAIIRSPRSFSIQLPLVPNHTLSAGADTVVAATVLSATDFPLVLSVVPIMKGIPDALFRIPVLLRVRGIARPTGSVGITIRPRYGLTTESYSLRVDGIAYRNPVPGEALLVDELAPGLHTIEIRSAEFQDRRINFEVIPGTNATVAVDLEPLRSSLSVDVPEVASVFLDGKKISNGGEPFDLPPGSHSILIRLGDYSLSRAFEVLPGGNYTISLALDILVEER